MCLFSYPVIVCDDSCEPRPHLMDYYSTGPQCCKLLLSKRLLQ